MCNAAEIERFLQKLRDAGVPSELHTFSGIPNEFDQHPEFAQACAELIDIFLDRHVLNPRTYPSFHPVGNDRFLVRPARKNI
jgi:hypothetical protein